MPRQTYTEVPRPILWLIRGGSLTIPGRKKAFVDSESIEIEPFYLSKFPVTNRQFEAFDANFQRSNLSRGDDTPATGVSGVQARAYCQWYAELARKPFRLPNEAEWMYACLGPGCEEQGSLDAGKRVIHRDNFTGSLDALLTVQPNDYGLYGMLGGIWEWSEAHQKIRAVASINLAQDEGLLYGGSWRLSLAEISPWSCRQEPFHSGRADFGFRLAKSLRS